VLLSSFCFDIPLCSMFVPVQVAQPIKHPWLNQKHGCPSMLALLPTLHPILGSPQLHSEPLPPWYSGSSLSNALREGGDTNAPCPSTLPTIEQKSLRVDRL